MCGDYDKFPFLCEAHIQEQTVCGRMNVYAFDAGCESKYVVNSEYVVYSILSFVALSRRVSSIWSEAKTPRAAS